MANCFKGLLFLGMLGFALLGVAAILPESAWDKTPPKLLAVRDFLAERGVIRPKYPPPQTKSVPPNTPPTLNTIAVTPPGAKEFATTDSTPSNSSPCENGLCSLPFSFSPFGANDSAPVSNSALAKGGDSGDALSHMSFDASPLSAGARPASFDQFGGTDESPLTYEPSAATLPPSGSFPADLYPSSGGQSSPSEMIPAPSALSPSHAMPNLPLPDFSPNTPPATDPSFPYAAPVLPLLANETASGFDSVAAPLAPVGLSPPTFQVGESTNDTGVEQALTAALTIAQTPGKTHEAFMHLNQFQQKYGTSLSVNQLARMNKALDRLAFDVFYNPNESLLEAPYTTAANQTLATIAAQYQVTPEFLAAVNNIPLPPEAVLPAGTRLKVVRGPVSAEVSLARMELLLKFNGLYAGRFKMGCAARAQTIRGDFTITRKVIHPEYTGPLADGRVGTVAGGAADNPLGSCWVELANGLGLQGTNHPETFVGQANAPVGGLIFSNKDITHLNILLATGSTVRILD